MKCSSEGHLRTLTIGSYSSSGKIGLIGRACTAASHIDA